MHKLRRRDFLAVAGAAGLLATAACSTGKPADKSAAGVTIKHRFGETKIPAPPKQVVTAGFTEQDDLLALGVIPIAITNWWGDQPFAVWPWAQPSLGPAQPTVLSLDNGIDFDKIASLKPDLIIAINAGVDQDTYNRLAAIAPTIPQAGEDAFFEPWKNQATAIGQAVFQADKMASLITNTDTKFADIAKSRPQFKDKKVLIMQGSFYLDNFVATLPGWRTEFLTQMGFVIPDDAQQFGVDANRALIPRDKAPATLSVADAVIWTTQSDDEQARLIADPTFAQLNSTIRKRNVFTGKDLAGAIAFSSPLSLPFVADQLPPMLATVIG
ncbi:MAG: iron complex transport system substrate-binding protein [Mycobacterium sp.]|jgi:iron complex transport system substrate-binding protein|nr:iron complex transport system substrate-binding protein [Mycobacterium sp.]